MSTTTITLIRAVNEGVLARAVVLGRRPDNRTFAVWHEDAAGRAFEAQDHRSARIALREFLAMCNRHKVIADLDAIDPLLAFLLRLTTELIQAKDKPE